MTHTESVNPPFFSFHLRQPGCFRNRTFTFVAIRGFSTISEIYQRIKSVTFRGQIFKREWKLVQIQIDLDQLASQLLVVFFGVIRAWRISFIITKHLFLHAGAFKLKGAFPHFSVTPVRRSSVLKSIFSSWTRPLKALHRTVFTQCIYVQHFLHEIYLYLARRKLQHPEWERLGSNHWHPI